MRCDNCGARNAEDASWCNQCYARFDAAEAAPDTAADTDQASASAPSGISSGDAASATAGSGSLRAGASASDASAAEDPGGGGQAPITSTADETGAGVGEDAGSETGRGPVEVGDVRDVDGVIEWRCRTCASWVALELSACSVCGAQRAGFGEQPRVDVAVEPQERNKVLGGGAAFPGVGHLLAGRTGSGITRVTLGALWLILGVWWLATTTASGNAPGVILLLGVLILWIASYLDVQALVDGKDERFGVRGLLWLVVGVTTLLMVAVAWIATGPTLG